MLIGFGNKSRSGKDTCADYLISECGFTKVSFADPLYEIASSIQNTLHIDEKKDPLLMQSIADAMKRTYGNDVFVVIAERKIKRLLSLGKSVVVSDVRHTEEFNMIKLHGGSCIKINRIDRIIDRDPTHISETQLDDALWDYEISNDSTFDSLYSSVDELLVKICH